MNSFAHGVRVLAKKPGFTAAAVLMLGLGIGANAAIFSLVNAFLWKPLKIHQAEELVGLYSRDARKPDSFRAFSYPNFVDLRGQRGVFTSVAAHNLALMGLTEGDSTRRLFADVVSSNYFAHGLEVVRLHAPPAPRRGFVPLLRDHGRPAVPWPRVYGRRGTTRQREAGGDRQLFLLEAPRRRCGDDWAVSAPQRAMVHGSRHRCGGFHRDHGFDGRRTVPAAGRLRRPGRQFGKPRKGVVRARLPCPDCAGAAAPGSDPGRSRWAACRHCRGDAKSLAGGEQGSDATGAPAFPAERFRRPHLGQ